jgi:hypothetical protein
MTSLESFVVFAIAYLLVVAFVIRQVHTRKWRDDELPPTGKVIRPIDWRR